MLFGYSSALKQQTLSLIHLSVACCHLVQFINLSLPSLNSLDLHDSHITCLCHIDFRGMGRPQLLSLGDNALISEVVHLPALSTAAPLFLLDLTSSRMHVLTLHHFSAFPKLHTLNMLGSSTQHITGATPQSLGERRVLDRSSCPVTVLPPCVFNTLDKLQSVYVSDLRPTA